MNCHQVYIDGFKKARELFKKELISANAVFSKESYFFWDEEKIYDLLLKDSVDFKKTYESFIPHAYKADFVKYLAVYKYGGWAIDPGILLSSSLALESFENIFLFKDVPNFQENKAIANNMFFCSEGSPFLEKAIESVCKNSFYKKTGSSPWDVTGPTLLWKIAQKDNLLDFAAGSYLPNTNSSMQREFRFVINNKNVAFSKPLKSYLERKVCHKTSYVFAWNEGKVYV